MVFIDAELRLQVIHSGDSTNVNNNLHRFLLQDLQCAHPAGLQGDHFLSPADTDDHGFYIAVVHVIGNNPGRGLSSR